ncbi:hypothetical protein GCM10010994_52010 [Chelatococcus reniformis]|uniref:Uncharacterized protein n=1 Tax=Chelatococcus reniformis TaxID=1494448 RepID=A0A916XP62_9HYPH|nr:hypothetical protein GCM10010994_52010 [Chelatococcus reniformis]
MLPLVVWSKLRKRRVARPKRGKPTRTPLDAEEVQAVDRFETAKTSGERHRGTATLIYDVDKPCAK